MSYSDPPGIAAQSASMSRGTARSTSSSGSASRPRITAVSSSASISRCGEEVAETTMSAPASASGSSSNETLSPWNALARLIARSRRRVATNTVWRRPNASALAVSSLDLAGPDDHDRAALPESPGSSRGERGRDGREAHRALADGGLRADPLAGLSAASNMPRVSGAGGLARQRGLVGALHLTLDLGLAVDVEWRPVTRR